MPDLPVKAERCPPPLRDVPGPRCAAPGPENLAVAGHAETCKLREGHAGSHMAVFGGAWWRWAK